MPLLLDENALPAVPVASAAVVKDGSMQTFKTDVAEESKTHRFGVFHLFRR